MLVATEPMNERRRCRSARSGYTGYLGDASADLSVTESTLGSFWKIHHVRRPWAFGVMHTG